VDFLTTLLSQHVANIIFLILFVGGLGLAIISIVLGGITDAVGGLFGGLGDLDMGGDGFGWISFTTICIGISGAGAGGILFNSMGIPPILVLLIGLLVGFICAYGAGRFIIVPLKRRQHSGTVNPSDIVGKTASVIAPMSAGAMGEILVAGRSVTARAVSSDMKFQTGDIVVVVRVEGTTAYVDKEATTESYPQPDQTKNEKEQ